MSRRFKNRSQMGTSLMELLIAIMIMAIVVGMVCEGLVHYGRMAKSQNFMQRAQKDVNLFTVQMNDQMLKSSTVNLVNANMVTYSGNDSYYLPDTSKPGSFIYRKDARVTTLRYIDADNKPDTLGNNRLEMSYVVKDAATGNVIEQKSGEILLSHVSPMIDPVTKANISPFALLTNGTRPYVRMRLKIGDRDTASVGSSAAAKAAKKDWDRITGKGYQGFVVDYILAPYNVSAVKTN